MSDYHSTHTGNIIDAAISAVIAGQAGIQGVKVNGVELTPDLSNKVDVSIPEAGIAGVKVNGVELEKDDEDKVDVPVPSLLNSTGQSTTAGMTQKAITDAIGSSTSGIAGVKVNGVELTKDSSNKVDVPVPVMQSSTGSSTSDGMTQAAITTALGGKVDTTSIVQATGESTTSVMSQKAVTDAIGSSTSGIAGVKVNGVELTKDSANKVDVPVPVLESTTGSSTTAGMTQNAITTALADKINTSSVVQSTGTSTTNIMSQKAVTDAIGSISSGIAGVKVNGVELTPDQSNKVDVPVPSLLNSTGQSTTSGMTQNAITDALSSKADSSSLSQVATSGSYDDLSDKPTIPTLLSTTGQSTTEGMTQKAVTDELDKKSELHTYYVVADKDDWVGQSAPYTQVFNMGVTPIGDVFFADLGSEITVDSLEDWSCISSVDVTGNVVTLTCLEDKPKNDLVVYLRGFTD